MRETLFDISREPLNGVKVTPESTFAMLLLLPEFMNILNESVVFS